MSPDHGQYLCHHSAEGERENGMRIGGKGITEMEVSGWMDRQAEKTMKKYLDRKVNVKSSHVAKFQYCFWTYL